MSLSVAQATAIGAGLQTASSVGQGLFGIRQGKKQRAHELSLWHMTNEYNSPKAQMDRLREAGLNPHLVHGNANQTDQPHQSPDEPTPNPFDSLMPALSQIAQIRATNMEIAKKEAEIENIRGNTQNQDIVRRDYELRQAVSQFDRYLRERQHDLDRQRFGHDVGMSRYQRELQQAQAQRDRARAELFLEQASSSRALTPVQVAKMRQDMRFSAELHEYNLQSNRARATIDQFNSRDRMLNLLELQLEKTIENLISQRERNEVRSLLPGLNVHRDHIPFFRPRRR